VAGGLEFGDIAESYIEAEAETSRLRVTAAGTENVLYDYVADFPSFEGASLFAAALNVDTGFSPILIGAATNVSGAPFLPLVDQQSELRAVHGSPDAGPVTVQVREQGDSGDWTDLVEGMEYRENSGYARVLGERDYDARVILDDSGTTVDLEPLSPEAGNAYSVFALGSVGDDNVTFLVEADQTGPAAEGDSEIRAVHGIVGGPTVDVVANDALTVFEELAHSTASEFAAVASDTYDIEVVTSDGGDNVIGPVELTLEDGAVYTAIALPENAEGEEEADLLIIQDR